MTDETKNEAGPERNADKTIEIDELARRLMDLWQDQVTAITANPDLAAQMSRLMAAMPPLNIGASQLKESSLLYPGLYVMSGIRISSPGCPCNSSFSVIKIFATLLRSAKIVNK